MVRRKAAEPSTNGKARAPRKSREKPHKPEQARVNLPWRIAADIPREEVSWLLDGWIANGVLTLVVGLPNAGKSTFLAYLASLAKRPMFLPAREESFGLFTAARFEANRVDLKKVAVLDQGTWRFPAAEHSLVQAIRDYRADLVMLDKVARHFSEGGSMNSEEVIGSGLESLGAIAAQTGVPVVAIRHPGKDELNVCPGSHEWRDTPRMILQCLYDKGPPERRYLRLWKDSCGAKTPPREVLLVGPDQHPPRWTFGDLARQEECDLAELSSDSDSRTKVDEAVELLEHLLAHGRMEVKEILLIAAREGLEPHTMKRASKRLGLEKPREGFGADQRKWWKLPTEPSWGVGQ